MAQEIIRTPFGNAPENEAVENAVAIVNSSMPMKDKDGEAVFDFSAAAEMGGLTGSVIQSAARQLKSEDVNGRVLTIVSIGVVKKPPQSVTDGDDPYYASVTFAEEPDAYYNAGSMLKNSCKAFMTVFGDPWLPGMAINTNEQLRRSGGWPVKIVTRKKADGSGQEYNMIYPA